ncbi:MEKHLA domain-containing protein [Synoicihabitans lomoniglobus]|uniref:MEKHLA domain-containing protein n=1 Tax=Synoicihabitans lomoniglobus TaxID=2909285 RepID=A0AAF0CMC4_9BACT|nr:MEKHLA domain-containing protein [Opitutaceae bacterium LMO-M01]WED63096.1 MEKHLA domain-containing protein [Opitutaceae bacterium LMO-M01]
MKPEPTAANEFLAVHVARLSESYTRLTGRDLRSGVVWNSTGGPAAWAEALYHAPFVLLSHDTAADPIFNYANRTAQRLFELNWAEITKLPSRFSAEPVSREERARLMAEVTQRGFIDDYRGVRISSTGRRFNIERATVWNVVDERGEVTGQAATFANWTPLE